jgi:uncharacterized protein YecE (DUF72 family)
LGKLPKDRYYVVEVRDQEWLNNDFYSLLRANSAALAWVDSLNMPQIGDVTSDFLYIRWEGNRAKVKGTLGRIEVDQTEGFGAWAEKLKPYLGKKTQIFGYFGKYYTGYPIADISRLSVLLSPNPGRNTL